MHPNRMDFVVLSHLRWDFVYQRPQHLFSRCARNHRVWFWEEPRFLEAIEPRLTADAVASSVVTLCPELPAGLDEAGQTDAQRQLLDMMVTRHDINDFALWYYTPMARSFTRHLEPAVTVYDCMDELSGFRGAPPGLREAESDLFSAADLVFTGGRSLYEAKRSRHRSVHCFPSSIEAQHFAQARTISSDPPDQAAIAHPRIGFCGVIDERMDIDLVRAIAQQHPEWHFVMIGPVVKISEADLPRATNIHYVGGKSYNDLPRYMAGWDIAMMPFAQNDSTKFISPTKTPEYLAAGLPVVSTPINDVVHPYGDQKLVEIADGPQEFAAAIVRCLRPEDRTEKTSRLQRVDAFLSRSSWDKTWDDMEALVLEVVSNGNGKDEKLDEERLELSSAAD